MNGPAGGRRPFETRARARSLRVTVLEPRVSLRSTHPTQRYEASYKSKWPGRARPSQNNLSLRLARRA
ncbi:hypothetical protein chiPu_0029999, partial [Chiloscyllium punctatum]|nr:hypothetical protein [Chiloscyllium punctatum]